MSVAVLAFIEQLISLGSSGLTAWATLSPILASGNDPTPEQWATLNTQADAAHAAVQGL